MNKPGLMTIALCAAGVAAFGCRADAGDSLAARLADGSGRALSAPRHLLAGQDAEQFVYLTNSADRAVSYIFRFEAVLKDRAVSAEEDTDVLPPQGLARIPVCFRVPAVTNRTEGQLRLIAAIDGIRHADAVPFVAYPEPVCAALPALLDPGGRLTNLCARLGCSLLPWSETNRTASLVIGPGALPGSFPSATNLLGLPAQGVSLLVFEQEPSWLMSELGMRVEGGPAASLAPALAGHPVLRGVERDDLGPWADAASTNGRPASMRIVPPYPPGWVPVLENVDSPGSPLLEYRAAGGSAVLCLLEPAGFAREGAVAAARLFRNLLAYAAGASGPADGQAAAPAASGLLPGGAPNPLSR